MTDFRGIEQRHQMSESVARIQKKEQDFYIEGNPTLSWRTAVGVLGAVVVGSGIACRIMTPEVFDGVVKTLTGGQ